MSLAIRYCLISALCALVILIVMPVSSVAQDVDADASPPVVLITGSNRGLGFEFAKQYAEKGWTVIATCRKPDSADDLQALAADNPNLIIEQLDVTDNAEIAALAEKYDGTPIDVLLNNAAVLGNQQDQRFGTFNYEMFESQYRINSLGPMKVTEAFIDHVEESNQKKIIFLASRAGSIASIQPPANLYSYRASKMAVHLFAYNLSLELPERGILVGLLNPGIVDTKGVLDLKPGDPVPEAFQDLMPLIESGVLQLMRPPESISAMIERIDELSPETNGVFQEYDGSVIPW